MCFGSPVWTLSILAGSDWAVGWMSPSGRCRVTNGGYQGPALPHCAVEPAGRADCRRSPVGGAWLLCRANAEPLPGGVSPEPALLSLWARRPNLSPFAVHSLPPLPHLTPLNCATLPRPSQPQAEASVPHGPTKPTRARQGKAPGGQLTAEVRKPGGTKEIIPHRKQPPPRAVTSPPHAGFCVVPISGCRAKVTTRPHRFYGLKVQF